ncbi:Helix-turn-helix domain-containing protein [Halorubrum xinjiangense]|uniref:Helix-turn-helix domain-containing protein n=1 Tax=Halorubrum xinjiangense TaxID=261291 RepID=A0A1G7LL29_9EURY|nr:helix-turn-helix domain-containing protein [Halorubrum xinjiangense]SDF49710.1 Helix-turn-helix domain-containing protein [Halorubrum xinjiangense]
MSDTRSRIRRHVRDTPGVHFNRIGRDLDIATGQAQYHLRRLVRDGELAVERIGGRAHYFDPAVDAWDRRTLAFLRRETAREIVVRLHAGGPTRPAALADDLDLAKSTVSWHVSTLADHGIVEKSPDRPMTVALARPERTAALLDEVSPSLPDRLVDRFVRTVDSLFDAES